MKTIPVIHHQSHEVSMRNAEIAHSLNCDGVFVISMDGDDIVAADSAENIKKQFPKMKVGINALRLSQIGAIKLSISRGLDMTWHDAYPNDNVYEIKELLKKHKHEYFASFAFKGQFPTGFKPTAEAHELSNQQFIPTTSGTGTGIAASLEKIREIYSYMKHHIRDYQLALASGLTPKNIFDYSHMITHALVNTGISSDFYNFDYNLLEEFIKNSKV